VKIKHNFIESTVDILSLQVKSLLPNMWSRYLRLSTAQSTGVMLLEVTNIRKKLQKFEQLVKSKQERLKKKELKSEVMKNMQRITKVAGTSASSSNTTVRQLLIHSIV